MKKSILTGFLLLFGLNLFSQAPKLSLSAYDGIMVAGYIDRGGFLNFTGPNINLVSGSSKFILGMLPSLRFKEDNSVPKNSLITPNLGFGFTYSYKKIAFQIPFYYNPKTLTNDGQWKIGIGVGLRLNEFNKS